MSYQKLDIYQLSKKLVLDIHQLTITELPRFELFEEGSQIRRSSKSICANIVEGYGRRRYKQDFIKFIVYALASCDETKMHLEILFETHSLKNKDTYDYLWNACDELGKKLNKFLQSIERSHQSIK